MEKDIEQAIEELEKRNNIKVDNYYCKVHSPNGFQTKDCYIGKDVFSQHINEWLEICSDNTQRKYLLELLGEYLYFPQSRYNEEFQNIIDTLEEQTGNINEILFVTFTAKKGTASGGANVSAALIMATMGNSVKENIITDVERATEDLIDRINNYKYIVFIDDIIGSGKTLYSNVGNFIERFYFNEDVTFFVVFLCGRIKKINEKLKQLRKKYKKNFKSIALYPLKRSLYENERKDKQQRIDNIIKIERIIEDNSDPNEKGEFFMGFEKNQLLVSFYYNTPNNTLSLFWRPTSISVPLFTRTSYRRPTIDDCRKNKKMLIENAYERGKMKNDFND